MNYGRALATTAASTKPLNEEIFFYSVILNIQREDRLSI